MQTCGVRVRSILWGAGVLLVLAAEPGAAAQTATDPSIRIAGADSTPAGLLVANSERASNRFAQPEVVREIDDPQNGARWLLVRNKEHPGGPGRLILAGKDGGNIVSH